MPKRLRSRAALAAPERGVTLIESLAAMSVVLIGLLGFSSLQVVVSRDHTFAARLTQASALAHDLAEHAQRWAYDDARLTPGTLTTVFSLDDSAVTGKWDMGRGATAAYTAHFSDKASDPNSDTDAALALGTGFQGLSNDADGDGTAEFTRYWNVVALDIGATGTANGKLVQVIVRWFEPGLGFRQVTASTFKPNPQGVLE